MTPHRKTMVFRPTSDLSQCVNLSVDWNVLPNLSMPALVCRAAQNLPGHLAAYLAIFVNNFTVDDGLADSLGSLDQPLVAAG